jgi:acetyltransferase-like isoleucine patch superfamily enzyme
MPFALVYRSAWIGDDCLIGNHASIREGATIGNRCIIGRNVTINYDAEIEDEVRIQDGTHITGCCKIGRGTFIGINVTTSNDRRREIVDYQWVGATPPIIGRGCLIGSGACIVPGVRIGDGAVIGAGALVTKDVPDGATVLGEPSRIRNNPVVSLPAASEHWREQRL